MAMAARLNLRMQKELNLLASDPPPGVSLPSLSNPSSDFSPSLTSIDAGIRGPQGTVYEHGVFCVKIQIPERYPFQPPIVTFSTPIYHPNIDNGGRICLDILNLPPKGAWVPSLNISTVLTSIGLLLSEPNPDDGLMCEASREYKYNRQAFDEKARAWTARFAKPGSCGANSSSCFSSNVQTDNSIEADSAAINVLSECQNASKTLLGRRKLSLGSKTMMEGNNNDNQENADPDVDLVTCSSKQIKPTGLGTSKLSLSQSHNDNQTNVDRLVEPLSYNCKQSKPTGLGTSELSLSQSHNDNQENVDPVVELLSCSFKDSKPTSSGTSKLSVSQSHKSVVRQNQQSQVAEMVSRDCYHSEEERNEIASIIVSDSEESADELKVSSKLRLPLRRKRCAR